MSDFLDDEWCAGCGGYIASARETGVSGIYFPGDKAILLCMPCYDAEEEAIDREGTNNLPGILDRYRRILAA